MTFWENSGFAKWSRKLCRLRPGNVAGNDYARPKVMVLTRRSVYTRLNNYRRHEMVVVPEGRPA